MFFFNDTATTEIYTLSLHDALPIGVLTERMPAVRSVTLGIWAGVGSRDETPRLAGASHYLEHLLFKGTRRRSARDRKSTRLNSSHANISYAVFCLKKKKHS